MFGLFNRIKTVDLSVTTPGKPPVEAQGLVGTGIEGATQFVLKDRAEVEKVAVIREGRNLVVQLGTDDGHFINITVKE